MQRYLAETSGDKCKPEHLYFKFDAYDLIKVRGVINIKIGSLGAADYYKVVNVGRPHERRQLLRRVLRRDMGVLGER